MLRKQTILQRSSWGKNGKILATRRTSRKLTFNYLKIWNPLYEFVPGWPTYTGMPEDTGLIAAFLASDEARWLTGEIIFGSGGLH
jgi:NAD(P)-dependent dehydrogenase (short-subunit alcohol dehydrogenase family)